MQRLRPLLFLLALGSCVPACGGDVAAPKSVQWRTSKPSPGVGRVRAAVVERPSADRARIDARWERLGGSDSCELELLLPEGVLLLEGERRRGLMGEGASGAGSWLVEFPLDGRALDAVVRFCANTTEGLRACETSVRLAE